MSVALRSLSEIIHRDTDRRFFVSRLISSCKTVFCEKGWLTGGAMLASLTVAKVYTVAFAYFCMEGAVRSVIEAREIGSLVARPLGDAGGWNSLALFSLLAFGSFAVQMVREGEYIRLKALFGKWIEKNPDNKKHLYSTITDVLGAFSSQCFFPKTVVSRRLIALQVIPEGDAILQEKKLARDRILQPILSTIHTDIEKGTGIKNYAHRICAGQKSLWETGGCTRQLGTVILGVALPLIFLVGAFISTMGEIALGHEIFIEREDLTAIGHFGEWPFNVVEALLVAFFLHLWCMINEGDFAIIRGIYKQHIGSVHEDIESYNRLCDIGNEELEQSATVCHYFKLPLDHTFEKIEPQNQVLDQP